MLGPPEPSPADAGGSYRVLDEFDSHTQGRSLLADPDLIEVVPPAINPVEIHDAEVRSTAKALLASWEEILESQRKGGVSPGPSYMTTLITLLESDLLEEGADLVQWRHIVAKHMVLLLEEQWTSLVSTLGEGDPSRARRLGKAVAFFVDFEDLLYAMLDVYRDHFEHLFWVLVTGSMAMSVGYERFSEQYEQSLGVPKRYKGKGLLDAAWAIAAISHDVCYPLDKLEAWFSEFLAQFFTDADLKNVLTVHHHELLLDESRGDYLAEIVSLFLRLSLPAKPVLTEATLTSRAFNKLVHTGLRATKAEGRHAILSSMSVMSHLYPPAPAPGTEGDSLLRKVVCSAALAIATHHYTREQIRSVSTDVGCSQPSANRFVVSRLLAYSDTPQEYCRRASKDSGAVGGARLRNLQYLAKPLGFTTNLTWPTISDDTMRPKEKCYEAMNKDPQLVVRVWRDGQDKDHASQFWF